MWLKNLLNWFNSLFAIVFLSVLLVEWIVSELVYVFLLSDWNKSWTFINVLQQNNDVEQRVCTNFHQVQSHTPIYK